MPLVMKAAITTEMIQPYDKKIKLRCPSHEEKSLSNEIIPKIVGLSVKELRKHGVIK